MGFNYDRALMVYPHYPCANAYTYRIRRCYCWHCTLADDSRWLPDSSDSEESDSEGSEESSSSEPPLNADQPATSENPSEIVLPTAVPSASSNTAEETTGEDSPATVTLSLVRSYCNNPAEVVRTTTIELPHALTSTTLMELQNYCETNRSKEFICHFPTCHNRSSNVWWALCDTHIFHHLLAVFTDDLRKFRPYGPDMIYRGTKCLVCQNPTRYPMWTSMTAQEFVRSNPDVREMPRWTYGLKEVRNLVFCPFCLMQFLDTIRIANLDSELPSEPFPDLLSHMQELNRFVTMLRSESILTIQTEGNTESAISVARWNYHTTGLS
jgi:hypothetical protein